MKLAALVQKLHPVDGDLLIVHLPENYYDHYNNSTTEVAKVVGREVNNPAVKILVVMGEIKIENLNPEERKKLKESL